MGKGSGREREKGHASIMGLQVVVVVLLGPVRVTRDLLEIKGAGEGAAEGETPTTISRSRPQVGPAWWI